MRRVREEEERSGEDDERSRGGNVGRGGEVRSEMRKKKGREIEIKEQRGD